MTHFEQLQQHIPNLKKLRIVDIGSGRGKFLFDVYKHGAHSVGVEPYGAYRDVTIARGCEMKLPVNVVYGTAEAIPFPDQSFDFANVNEVYEHIESPPLMLKELYRILSSGGFAYVSVPNRFGFKDPHYHLYGINWLPRSLAEKILDFLGKTKKGTRAGRQKLSDMHYKTFQSAGLLFKAFGFFSSDIRELKIKKKVPKWAQAVVFLLYRPFRFCYFDTFHFLIKKQ